MSSNVLMVPNCKEDNSANVRWSLLPLSISFLSLAHTPPLYHQDLSLFCLFSWAMAQQISWFTSLKCDKYRVTWRESELLSLRASLAVPKSQQATFFHSWTPLNIHTRPYKPARQCLVSANSKTTKHNFCSELKHLVIGQLSQTGDKHKRIMAQKISFLSSDIFRV